jgi:sulfur carrier protein
VNIYVNGVQTLVESNSLERVLVQLGYQDVTVATAINGDFVPLSQRKNSSIKDGDKLEILAPMQGG